MQPPACGALPEAAIASDQAHPLVAYWILGATLGATKQGSEARFARKRRRINIEFDYYKPEGREFESLRACHFPRKYADFFKETSAPPSPLFATELFVSTRK